jgi:hypothetical protein
MDFMEYLYNLIPVYHKKKEKQVPGWEFSPVYNLIIGLLIL